MAKKKNRNIVILKNITDLETEINYTDFEYKSYFNHLCNIIPNKEKERLEIEEIGNNKLSEKGLVYVFVIENKILKIGHTINSIKDRVGSYNCGKRDNRINGTCSTTNYFILQSLLEINLLVQVYSFFPEQPTYEIFGKSVQSSHPPAKTAEKVILQTLDKKPIGCTQT